MKFYKNNYFVKVFLFIFVAFYFVFQLIYINADTPVFLSDNAGAYCDEGYKTFDARNLTLFGKTHWTEKDEYPGWSKGSPVTVYFNFLFFKMFGVSLAVARMGNLLFAIGSLLLFYLILNKAYDQKTALLGFFLCTVNQVFFFYSRLALFEFKMMFFIMLGIYFMQRVRKNIYYVIPVVICSVAAYYCKATAILFYISVLVYFALTYQDGKYFKKIIRTRNLITILVAFISVFSFFEYLFIFHREFYDSMSLLGRHVRSPMGAVFYWVSQPFFTKSPILAFLAIIFIGNIIIKIAEDKSYDKNDLFFMIWLISGTVILAFVTYQPLRYYPYLIYPLIAVAIRGILLLPSIWITLLEEEKLWLKGIVVVFSIYILVIHTGFLRFIPVKSESGWDLEAVRDLIYFSATALFIIAIAYFYTRNRWELRDLFEKAPKQYFSVVLVALILAFQAIPVARWALNPKYELEDAYKKINELPSGAILVGDWAPQLSINTDKKSLYLTMQRKGKWTQNFTNLNDIEPNYLVIVDGLNDYILKQFNLKYPDVAKDTPHYKLNYAGRTILFYELAF